MSKLLVPKLTVPTLAVATFVALITLTVSSPFHSSDWDSYGASPGYYSDDVYTSSMSSHALPVKIITYCQTGVIGGAIGAWTAVRAKDKNQTTCLIDKSNRLGGHCNSIYYSNTSIFPWQDIGVAAYINDESPFLNGRWDCGNKTFAKFSRFGTPYPFPALGIPQPFFADLSNGNGVSPSPTPTITVADIENLVINLTERYPLLKSCKNPAIVPADLRMTFRAYNATYAYIQPFSHMLLQMGRQGSFNLDSEMFYILREMLVYLTALTKPGVLYTFLGGCQVAYNNIATFIQPVGATQQYLFYNADVRRVRRPLFSGGKVRVEFYVGAQLHIMFLDRLVVATDPTKLDFMDLNVVEQVALSRVTTHPGFYSVELQVTNNSFPSVTMVNFSNTANANEPTRPILGMVYQGIPGVMAGSASAKVPMTLSDMITVVQANTAQLGTLPSPISGTVVRVIEHEGYFPHIKNLSDTPYAYGFIDAVVDGLETDCITLCGGLFPYADTVQGVANCDEKLDTLCP